MEAFFDWFRLLYDETGINLTFIYDSFDRVRLVRGFWTTILLSAVCLVFSVIIGIVGAWLQGSRLKWTRSIAAAGSALFLLLRSGQSDAQGTERMGGLRTNPG